MKLMQISVVVMFSLYLSLNVAEASGDLSVSGTTTTKNLTITNVDCSSMANGGALTADAAGVVSCTDDDSGGSLDAAYDHGGAGAGRTITADNGAVKIQDTDGLELDTGSLQQMPGDPVSLGNLTLSGGAIHVAVSGRYAYVLGTDLNIVDVTDPGTPVLVGNLDPCPPPCIPSGLAVSGRYAYTLDNELGELIVMDVSNPGNPVLVGRMVVGTGPGSVFVSGRYAYVINTYLDDLKVIDVSDPDKPSIVGSLGIGGLPRSIHVSGKYAYVVNSSAGDLEIIDVSNPQSPSLVNSFSSGPGPLSAWSVYVSGSYAYVADAASNALITINVSDPSAPSTADTLPIGGAPSSVFVSGRYIYVVDGLSDDLKVIDASDPYNLDLAGSLSLETTPGGSSFLPSVYVSGRYAYVADSYSAELEVIDISGAEVTSMVAHSLEAGNLQVRNDVIAQGQLQVIGGINVGTGGIFTDGNVGVSGTIAIANDVVPISSPANVVQLYAQDVLVSPKVFRSELKVRDELGNITTLSPHNFSLTGQPSESMAWSFYSENDTGKINIDMLRTVRLVEAMSGRKLVHTEPKGTTETDTGIDAGVIPSGLPSVEELQSKIESYQKLVAPLMQAVQTLKEENERLVHRVEVLEKKSD